MAKSAATGFWVLPESRSAQPYLVDLTGSTATFNALRKIIDTVMLEPFMLANLTAYGDEDGRLKRRPPNAWLRGNGTVYDVVGTIVIGGKATFRGLTPQQAAWVEHNLVHW